LHPYFANKVCLAVSGHTKMTPTAVISFLALLSFGSANVMMKKGESVTFGLDDNGLLWPLPDSNEPGGVIYHAVHCYQMSEGRVHKADDKISQAHLKHCDKFTQKVLEFFKKNPTFKVDKTACDIFDSWQHKQSVVYQAKLAYSLYETAQGAYNSLLRSSDHAYSNAHKISQYDAYSLLAGHNFGTLKAKSVNGEPLTVQETAYLESWFSAENIRFAAMGVYCAVKGDLGHLAQVEKNIK